MQNTLKFIIDIELKASYKVSVSCDTKIMTMHS